MSSRQLLICAVIAVATVLAGVLRYAGGAAVPAFVAAGVALAGLAWLVAFATESLGARLGPGMTGLLQSTLGNLPEFFVVVFALNAGEVLVAQTSLVGSLLANGLLVLGLTIIVGAYESEDGLMRFKARLPNDTMTMLMLAVFVIVLLGIANSAGDVAARHSRAISVIAALCLLGVYGLWLNSYLRADTAAVVELPGEPPPLALTLGLLAIAGTASAFVSDWFIHALAPAINQLGISRAFAGLVIVAIAGNAVENTTAVLLAAKGEADLAISVVKNSVAQIAVFLFPILILVSLLFKDALTFVLPPVYIASLALSALAIWQITGDGEARDYEGASLVSLFVIVAAVAWFE
ncbi:MAG: Ca2+:H+ antiporter [Solirubrobacterales bacterium]|nr:Ca2+:H+ antiporter [Solirubrobacterales bacterium]